MKTEFARVDPSNTNDSPPVRRAGRKSLSGLLILSLLILIAALLFVVRPFSYRSPTVDILGSYFPAWMICMVAGLTLTLISRWIIRAYHLGPYVSPASLIYTCLMLIYTYLTWIIVYQN